MSDTWIGELAFMVSVLLPCIFCHFLDGHMGWCTDVYHAVLAAMVQNSIIVHFLDRQVDCCTSLRDTNIAAIVQNGIIVFIF